MNKYQTIAQVEQALKPYVLIASTMTGKGLTIDRTQRLAERVGNPQDKMRVVHVAGTSGKTSTCYYVADLLQRSGAKVGLTVSPHMDSITERVQIDGAPLPKGAFCAYFGEFMEYVARLDEMPTYFELMMVFAFWVFQKENVDYAVIETGLGGLHDSSNITSRADKLCVLTDIGYDHMHVLGRSIEEIATQKVGIVKPHNTLVMYEQSEAVMNVVREHVDRQQGRLVVEKPATVEYYQRRNWRLALAAYEQLRGRDSLKRLNGEDIERSQHLHVPGRMDIFKKSGKTIVLDGAHNEQKMRAFLKSFTAKFPGIKFLVLLALKQGKELEQLVPLLVPHTSRLIATQLSGSQDTLIHSVDPNEIAEAFKPGVEEIYAENDLTLAFDRLLSTSEKVVVVTGSLYLVAEVRKLLHTLA